MAETAEESTRRSLVLGLGGGRNPLDPIDEQLLAVYTALLQVEPLM